ncbi:WD repeat protein [Talaromyces proteolyticus]|uniref:WD repeat protein n=1 Tax=Talaromyces proteolyticus TaxID=1131652 RepID=A0AAD4KVU3_9EURO|nr:WD repeat protein [Talaromyces proteolyticus]KAH8700921.1 WD repeat protein [Talaromyces proteolyticus]
MSISLEHFDGRVPVTGLKTFQYGNLSLLLQGQGPFASVINTESGKLLSRIRVFRRNNIYGYMIDESRHNGADNIDILAWGGQSLRIISISSQDGNISVAHTTSEYAAPDWIYDICPANVDDKSSLAYLVTGHNSLLCLDVGNTTTSKYSKAIRLRRVAAGVRSTLYSANLVALSPSHILITAGTVFGEIIVWSCFRETENSDYSGSAKSSIHHFFTGHDGSVFGVNISDEMTLTAGGGSGRLLASCSDDRTVRIWDISDCCHATSTDVTAYSTDGFDLRSTGYGSTAPVSIAGGSESAVAKAWGHVSRIWGVYFLPVKEGTSTVINLVSRGEDATCQLWRLDLSLQPGKEMRYDLKNIMQLNHHSGKHIWSLALARDEHDAITVFSGGGDGGIRTFRLDYFGHLASKIELPERSPYNSGTMVKFAHSKVDNGDLPRSSAFVSRDSFIVANASGAVQLGSIDLSSTSARFQERPHITWQGIAVEQDLRSVSLMDSLPHSGIAVIGSSSKRLWVYDHRTKALTELVTVQYRPVRIVMLEGTVDASDGRMSFSFIVSYADTRQVGLFRYDFSESGQNLQRTELSLPTHFQATVAAIFCHGKYLAIGGKSGGILVYRLDVEVDRIDHLFHMERVHGKEYVACLVPIDDPDNTNTGYIFSGGQDGHYSVHRLRHQPGVGGSEAFQAIHRASTPFSHVENAYFDSTTGDFVLLGSRGGIFIIWNETTQTELMKVNCGGGHRVLQFMPGLGESGSGIVMGILQRFLHIVVTDSVTPRPLRAGSHGRELKSLAIANVTGDATSVPLIASGAEDTAIRISIPRKVTDDSMSESLQCVRVMTRHVAGIQHVKWSANRRFLFSSGGAEEFFAWRIRYVPKFGVAAFMEAAIPRDNAEVELRITSFDVLNLKSTADGDCFLLAMVYSDSQVKMFKYTSSPTKCAFDLIGRGMYSTNCLTEVHFVEVGSTTYLVTGSTDGHLAFWPLGLDNEQWIAAEGMLSIKWVIHHPIHSSSIKSLDIAKLSPTSHLLIGGGDDNSLSVTLFRSNDTNKSDIATVSIQNAHASAITAIKVLTTTYHPSSNHPPSAAASSKRNLITVTIASSGNDQRVKIWSVSIDNNKPATQAVTVSLEINRYCSVADIIAMDVLESSERMLVIGGVGVEMLRL